MVACAILSDNTHRAARELKRQGLPIPRTTLRDWIEKNPEEYAQVRQRELPRLKAKLAVQHEDLARRQIEVSSRFTERLAKEAADLPLRDVSTAQRNLDVGSGIHTQRAAELRGDVTLVHHKRDLEATLAALRRLGLIVDSDAEEIPIHEIPAQIEDDPP